LDREEAAFAVFIERLTATFFLRVAGMIQLLLSIMEIFFSQTDWDDGSLTKLVLSREDFLKIPKVGGPATAGNFTTLGILQIHDSGSSQSAGRKRTGIISPGPNLSTHGFYGL
jgi:hypothetical protein